MQGRADYKFIVRYGEITAEGVAVYDLNSRQFVYLNRSMGQIFEGADQQLLEDPNTIKTIVHPRDLQFVESRYRELLSIGCIPATEFRINLAGNEKHLSCEVLWLEESYTFAIFTRDISAARRHEEYVLKFTAQKDALLDMLANQPGGLHSLSREVSGTAVPLHDSPHPAKEKPLRTISESAAYCIDIIHHFMEKDLAASTEIAVKKSRFDAVERISMVMEILREMNSKKTFELRAVTQNRNLESDPVKFLQVIRHVLSKAVKYTAENGTISVEINEEDRQFVIRIRDNGIGISPALFTNQRAEKSNGAGLNLITKLMELMHGSIEMNHLENEGFLVILRFPGM